MNGKNFVVVALRGAGKTTWIKALLNKWRGRKDYILDYYYEYLKYKNYFTDKADKELFLDCIDTEASHKQASCNILFEEATFYLRNIGITDGRIIRQLTGAHHTCNINIFVFHSLLAVPSDIMRLIDFWVIFQTDAQEKNKVLKHFEGYPKIIEKYLDVQKKTHGTSFNRDKKTYPDERSKKFFHYHRVHAR